MTSPSYVPLVKSASTVANPLLLHDRSCRGSLTSRDRTLRTLFHGVIVVVHGYSRESGEQSDPVEQGVGWGRERRGESRSVDGMSDEVVLCGQDGVGAGGDW